MMRNRQDLERELLLAGASKEEIPSLSRIAESLHQSGRGSSPFGLIRASRPARMIIPAVSAGVFLFAAGFMTSGVARLSLPGEPLYPLKRLNERVILMAEPDMQTVVMMRRSDEVRRLVQEGADEEVILETLSAYKHEYEGASARYGESYEYHLASAYSVEALTAARNQAEGRVRKLIERSVMDAREQ